MDWMSGVDWILWGSGLLAVGTYLHAVFAVLPVDVLYAIDNHQRTQQMPYLSFARWLARALGNTRLADKYAPVEGLPAHHEIRTHDLRGATWLIMMVGAICVFGSELTSHSGSQGVWVVALVVAVALAVNRKWLRPEHDRLRHEYETSISHHEYDHGA